MYLLYFLTVAFKYLLLGYPTEYDVRYISRYIELQLLFWREGQFDSLTHHLTVLYDVMLLPLSISI